VTNTHCWHFQQLHHQTSQNERTVSSLTCISTIKSPEIAMLYRKIYGQKCELAKILNNQSTK